MTTSFYAFWLFSGLVAGLVFMYFATRSHFGRERRIYRIGLVIAAVNYVLFAIVWGNPIWFGIEVVGVLGYGLFAVLGKRVSYYFVAFGWLIHPVWDGLLHLNGPGREVAPLWYSVACISFDILLGAFIIFRVRSWRTPPAPSNKSLHGAH